jgi:hypothetical protein
MKFATLINTRTIITVNIVLITFLLCANMISSLHGLEEFSQENVHDLIEENMIDSENDPKSLVDKAMTFSNDNVDKKLLMLIHMYDELGKQENNKIKNKWRYG